MRLRFFITLVFTVSALAAVSVRADEPSCHAAARECEQNIRQMLGGRRYVGVQIVDLKPGLVVKAVLPDSPASRADMRAGDRLYAVNGKSVREATAKEFKQLLSEASRTGKLWVILQRRGALKKVDMRLEPYPKAYIDEVITRHLAQSHSPTTGGDR